jgi:hypothetical protein
MELNDDGIGADQLAYARVLGVITNAGLAALVVLFALYVFGVVDPHVAHARLPELWKLPAPRFLEAAGIAPGWGWTSLLPRADILTLVGIAALAFASVPCLALIMPVYWRTRQRALLLICAFEILVILLAASGLVTGGH